MGFLGVYTALYHYQPQGENELEIQEGELLYLLEKGEDGWWKAKKKAANDEDDEPTGLIPANYVEKVGLGTIFRTTLAYPSSVYPFLVYVISDRCST